MLYPFYEKELSKLPICPKCHKTNTVEKMPYLAMSDFFCCLKCNIEWTANGIVREISTGNYYLIESKEDEKISYKGNTEMDVGFVFAPYVS